MPLAVISGATGAVGAATAKCLCQLGFRTALLSRSAHELTDLIRSHTALKRRAIPICCDLKDRAFLMSELQRIFDRFGAPALFAHCAASLGPVGAFFAQDPKIWQTAFEDNVYSLTNCLRAWDSGLSGAARPARFVYLTSAAARFVDAGESQYSSAKAANEQLLKHIRSEMVGDLRRVLILNPGLVKGNRLTREECRDDPIEQSHKVSSPPDVARTILWLGLDPSIDKDLSWFFQHDPDVQRKSCDFMTKLKEQAVNR